MLFTLHPGLGSEYALLVKDSAYAFVIGVVDMMAYADWIRKATMDTVTPYFIAAFLYILLTFPIASWLDKWGSRKKEAVGVGEEMTNTDVVIECKNLWKTYRDIIAVKGVSAS